jgi:hypothetical protein
VGSEIAWPVSAPEMDSFNGRALLAHELAHVVQQRAGTRAAFDSGQPATALTWARTA